MGKDEKETLPPPPGVAKGAVRDNLEVICFAVLMIMFFKTFVGQQFTIPSGSMRNTLMIGDHLLVNKFVFASPQWSWEEKLFPMRHVKKGDIIVFRYPLNRDQDFVKRCVALPGDTVLVKDKRLFINGKQITGTWEHHRMSDEVDQPLSEALGQIIYKDPPESGPWPQGRYIGTIQKPSDDASSPALWPYLDPEVQTMDQQGQQPLPGGFRDQLGPFKVPNGFLMAMGDNRDNSSDSRYWGLLPMDHLRGRPFVVWWSYREQDNDDANAKVPMNPGDVVGNFVEGARYFFTRTRWERTGYIPK